MVARQIVWQLLFNSFANEYSFFGCLSLEGVFLPDDKHGDRGRKKNKKVVVKKVT